MGANAGAPVSVRRLNECWIDGFSKATYNAETFQQVCDAVCAPICDAYANSEHHIYSTQPATG